MSNVMPNNGTGFATVLLAEDNDDDVFFMRRAWKAAELENPLQVVRDGQQALDYFSGTGVYSDREKFPLPAVLLLDLKLPFRSGHEILRWLRSNPPRQKCIVIVLTSSSAVSDVSQAYLEGANAYLVKPAGGGKLAEMLRAFKAFWFDCNTGP